MAVTYLEHEIASFVGERKPLPIDWRNRVRLKPKHGHDERHLDLPGDAGNQFRLILRRNNINPLDFSIILAIQAPQSGRLFRLRRYNGRSHQHTNHIEDETFYDFHIHLATERYQQLGTREDAYAEPADRYNDFHSALRCLLDEVNLEMPPEPQGSLFKEG